jgi:hypothetical protein
MKKLFISSLLIFFTFLTTFSQQFSISYSSSVFSEPFTGNIFLLLSKYHKNPVEAAIGLELFPCYSVYVTNLLPGSTVTIDDNATSYPFKLSDIERGDYFVQAILDRNLGGRSIAESPGNIYSQPIKTIFTKDTNKLFTINCDQILPEQIFIETEFVKELKVTSDLVTKFNKRSITINAAVMLPKEYFTEPKRKFPVVFTIFGYGWDYHKYSGVIESKYGQLDSSACIRVLLDGNCPLGHSVYANSENNGPWGDALVEEFIPSLEKQYRCNGARLLTGHSSGGWASLWLQTHYPTVFAGAWSSAPDEVDFRGFCNINIYIEKNMFYDKNGDFRLSSSIAGRWPWLYLKDVYQQENVISRGEQMHSYEAVFSNKGKDGFPERICNPNTGEIDSITVTRWKDYDISLYLRTNWDKLKQDLDGKVRISVGEQDNWFLNYPVHLLEKEMIKLNSKFVFAYYPGDHSTVFTAEYRNNGIQFLDQKYKEWLDKTRRTNK